MTLQDDRPRTGRSGTGAGGTPTRVGADHDRSVLRGIWSYRTTDAAIAGHDVDFAEHFYLGVHNADRVELVPVPDLSFSFRFRSIGDDRLVVRNSRIAAVRKGMLGPDRRYVLAWSPSGGIVFDAGEETEVVLRPGVPVMFPTRRAFRSEAAPGTLNLLDFDASYLECLAAGRTGDSLRALTFRHEADRTALARLRSTVAAAMPRFLDPATPQQERDVLVRAVADDLLDAFLAATAPDARVPYGSVVRAAKVFMETHCAEPLRAEDVAAAAGVTSRAVQQAFARAGEPGPMSYLRGIRLARVRAELQRADEGETTVADAAARWTFGHPGRFSGYYHDVFGEFPHETLQRRPRP